ncbi:MAG: hypothetical protein AB7U42_15615 [Nocardioides sp.]
MEAHMDRCVLWARAGALGSIAFGLGIAGHVSAEGLLPGPVVLVVMLLVALLSSASLLKRPASGLRLVAMLVGGQTLVHLALTVTAGHAGDPVRTSLGHRSTALSSLPVVDGHRVGSLQDAYQSVAGQPSGTPTLPVGHLVNDMSTHAPMMIAHLAAAALVGLWLAYGEHCLWTVIALTGRRVRAITYALVPLLIDLPGSGARSGGLTLAVPVCWWQARPPSRRGPPTLSA